MNDKHQLYPPIEYTRKKLGIPPIPEVTPRHRKSFGVLKAFPTYPWEPPEVKREMKARFERWHKGIEPIPERFKQLLYREKDLAPGNNRTEDAEREIEHREEEEVRLEHRFLSARTQPERDEALRELLKLDTGYLNEPPILRRLGELYDMATASRLKKKKAYARKQLKNLKLLLTDYQLDLTGYWTRA